MDNLQQRFVWDLDLADYAPKTKKQYLLDFNAFMAYCQDSPESMTGFDLCKAFICGAGWERAA